MSDHLGRKRHNLHELLFAQLAANGAEDAGGPRLTRVGDEHRRVLVEANVGAIFPLGLLGRADDDGAHDLALLDLARRDRVLDGHDHHVAQTRIAPLGAAEYTNDQGAPGARVVRDLENRFLLHHGPFPLVLNAPARRFRRRATVWSWRAAGFP